MAVHSMVGDGAPTKHAVRVDWFRRDPGGATIFVMPSREDSATPQLVVERDGSAAIPHG